MELWFFFLLLNPNTRWYEPCGTLQSRIGCRACCTAGVQMYEKKPNQKVVGGVLPKEEKKAEADQAEKSQNPAPGQSPSSDSFHLFSKEAKVIRRWTKFRFRHSRTDRSCRIVYESVCSSDFVLRYSRERRQKYFCSSIKDVLNLIFSLRDSTREES